MITPPLPSEKNPQSSKTSFWNKIVKYTGNDVDFVSEVSTVSRIQTPEKPKNIKKTILTGGFVLVTFYLLLCSYILLNPENALFFNNIFGIQYLTVQLILKYTIFVFYSAFGLFLMVFFLFFWFRAMTIRTKKKSKKITISILAVLFWLLFFGNIALFAWTYNEFRKIDFGNLDSRVIIYNNSLLKFVKNDQDLKSAVVDTKNQIGPLTVRYDLSFHVKKEARDKGLVLSQPYEFEIDFDGDKRPDRGSGSNVGIEIPVSDTARAPVVAPQFEYNITKKYAPTATIRGIDVSGEPITLTLDIPAIDIKKIVKIGRKPLQNGGIQYTFDATDLDDLGQAEWTIIGDPAFRTLGYQLSPDRVFEKSATICLRMFRGNNPLPGAACDWRFVTEETTKSNIQNTEITYKIDSIDSLKYEFSINPTTLQGEIRSIQWYIDGDIYVGKFDSGTEKIFDYQFKTAGTYAIEAEIEDSLWNTVRVSTPSSIITARMVELKDGYGLKISDESGSDLARESYEKSTQSYILPDFYTPGILRLDATNIRADGPRLKLLRADWDRDNDGVFETEWLSYDMPVDLPGRYDIRVRYTFTDLEFDGTNVAIYHFDKISLVGVAKNIDVRLTIQSDSEYAPATIRLDASNSRVKKGDIRKYIYDFGDGQIHEWEWIVPPHTYKKPGEYTITVTAVTNTGERATKKYNLVVKKPQETVDIVASIASGTAKSWLPVTFDLQIRGIVQSVSWDFGDGSGQITGSSIVHEFRNPGTYTIRATAEFASGISESDTLTYIVQ